MIAHVRGVVAHRGSGHVVVDVNGVGYLVHVAAADRVPARGQQVELHTSMQVREDSMTLYGFFDRSGIEIFELLLSSSGIGPKIALAALRTLDADTLVTAIATGDVATLTSVPGIGKKVAERLILELKDKVGVPDVGPAIDSVGGMNGGASPLGDAREALASLGYTAAEINAALAGADVASDAAGLLRHALRNLNALATAR